MRYVKSYSIFGIEFWRYYNNDPIELIPDLTLPSAIVMDASILLVE